MSPMPFPTRPRAQRCVYFLQPEGGGPIKIGRARSVQRRLAQLQIGSSVPLRVRAIWPIVNLSLSAEIEAELHRHFVADQIRGEWFRPSAELEATIERGADAIRASWGQRDARFELRRLLAEVRAEFRGEDVAPVLHREGS